jgi:hypothetical protein
MTDYHVVRARPDLQALLDGVVADQAQLVAVLGLVLPTVVLVSGLHPQVARYVSGSALRGHKPIILLDYPLIAKAAQQFGFDLTDELEATILHELGHGYLDLQGVLGADPTDEEDLVEVFASFYQRGRDSQGALALLDRYVSKRQQLRSTS